jgi:uncharacterized protein
LKKIGLLSDTHSFLEPRILDLFKDCDEIWHAGDFGTLAIADQLLTLNKPLRGVWGNIDGMDIRTTFQEHERFVYEGLDVWMTHIGGYPGKYPKNIQAVLEENTPKLFICGHSHILKVIPDKKYNLLHINPGACGNEGWHSVKTVIRFEVENGKIGQLEVIELGKRG